MMQKRFLITFILFYCLATIAFAQKGTIRGKVIDDATGESMIGVSVFLEGTSIGAATDLEGSFSFSADPGTYNIQATFISFNTKTISGVEVKAGEVSNLGTIRLGESVEQMQEVVVKAQVIRETEAALLTIKRKSPNMIDGISAETFSKIGDSDAAGAIKRVSGVSVQGGQYVFVRGLGDRYTKTTLGGMEIPGLDPDRNAVQMDIFPTNLINNIVVYKTFTPDLSADFVGGMVDIDTKDFPARRTSSFSASINYNPSMHFNDDYLTYEGGSTDFLGFDNGTRDLPYDASANGDLPNPTSQSRRDQLGEVTRRFNPNMAVFKKSNLPDMSLSYSHGNQIDMSGFKWGYNAAINYNISSQFYEDARDASYVKPNNQEEYQLEPDTRFVGPLSSRDAQFSALLGTAIKTDNSKYSIKFLSITNGTERAALRTRVRSNNNFNTALVDGLDYTERKLNNITFNGENYFKGSKSTLTYGVSGTMSTINDKDVRITPFTEDENGNYVINAQEGGEPNRIWRFLDEQNVNAKVDFVKEFDWNGQDSKLKAGLSNIYKTRDFEIEDFFLGIRFQNDLPQPLNGNADNLLVDENIISGELDGDVFAQSRYASSNTYSGTINNFGAYVSGEIGLAEELKTIIGVRIENYNQFFTGENQQGTEVYENDNVLNSTEFFPSINFTYSPTESSNLRASYSRTIARPSFKEKSTVEIQDVLTGRTFIGEIELVETNINNYDLRWETFFKRGQTVSIGAFYKTFENPIELVRQSANANNIKPTNVGDAYILGGEMEVRKDLSFISEFFGDFAVSSNFTFTEAIVNIDDEEKQGRLNSLRDGEELKEQRRFVGQPPYIINGALNYQNFETNWEGSLSYNVQGPTLAIVGVNRTPDTYTVPFHSLNFNISKAFGADDRHKLGLRVTNILNDDRERVFQSFQSEDAIETLRSPGRAFRIKYSFSF